MTYEVNYYNTSSWKFYKRLQHPRINFFKFLCGPFLKSLFDLLQYCFYFIFLAFWPRGMRNLNSLTKDWTHTPCIGRWSLNYWTAREIPKIKFLMMEFQTCNNWKGLPGVSVVKNYPANAGDTGSISGSRRSTREENGNPLQYSCPWEIPWTWEPGRPQSMGSQRVRHNWATEQQQQTTEDNLEERSVAHGLSINIHACPGIGDTGMDMSVIQADRVHSGWSQDHPGTPRMWWWLSPSGWPHFPGCAKSIWLCRPTPSVAGPSISWQSESELLRLPALPTCHLSRSPNSWWKPILP